jgi:hypothetical protein
VTLHRSASAIQTSLIALGLIAALAWLTQNKEIKEFNEYRDHYP